MTEPKRFAFGASRNSVLWIWADRLEYEKSKLFGKSESAVIPFESITAFHADARFGIRSVGLGVAGGKPVAFDAVEDADEIVAILRDRMNEWRRLRGEPNKYLFFGTFGIGEFWVGDGRVEYNNPTMFGKPQLSYIPFESITGFFADAHLGGRTKRVRISVGGGDGIAFSAVDNIDADEFVETLRARLAKQSQPTASPSSDADELERLGSLFERGLLSDEEFAAAKKKLLGS